MPFRAGAHVLALLSPDCVSGRFQNGWGRGLNKGPRSQGMFRLPRGKIISVDPTLLLAEISHSVWWKSTTLICAAKKQVHKISEIS
jgi:hypothetical protein